MDKILSDGNDVTMPYILQNTYLPKHKKPLSIQQHRASASTAALKHLTWTGTRQAKHHKQTPHNIAPRILLLYYILYIIIIIILYYY
jgi:hypothetical protein